MRKRMSIIAVLFDVASSFLSSRFCLLESIRYEQFSLPASVLFLSITLRGGLMTGVPKQQVPRFRGFAYLCASIFRSKGLIL